MSSEHINFQLAHFVSSYGTVGRIPASTCPEVSFVGRSNVGKSSIMNKLFNRKHLVKVSSTPGKTANINFFEADGVHFVDLPGYGYAKRSKAERARWGSLIGEFFALDRSFNLVVSLLDIRHDPSDLDLNMIRFLEESDLTHQFVLTKADKLGRGRQAQRRAAIAEKLGRNKVELLVTSSVTGQGIDELKHVIEMHCLEP